MAYCYFNGEIVEESKASIPLHHLGVQRGFGVFDLFRGRQGKPVFMEDHLDRFERSQQFLGLSDLISKVEIRQAVADLQQKNGFSESTFKLMLLGDGSESEMMLKPFFYILHLDLSKHQNPDSSSIILHEYLREYPEIKSINYLTSNRLHVKRMKVNAIDVVYHKDGLITEASRSNVFMVQSGEIITPKNNILNGITRKQILSFCNDIGTIHVRDVTLDEFRSADEIFLTSTLKEVLPIVEVDGKKVGDGQIGAVSKKIKRRFIDHLHQ
ncbi:aminotransferase class IV [Ekhidna sp.]|uniref:aminotransferase class IV n=1 Tax=Ekhidna sp. TaxID=2608089 RepID=UPI003517FBA0